MPRIKKLRLAQTHKLTSLSDHLAKVTNFGSEEIRVLLLVHQKMEEAGPLDRNRFREILCVVFEITDDVMLDLVFRAFDADQDGYVNDIEWVRGMSTMLRGTLEQLTDFTYTVYDMNGDGALAREELHHCLKGCIFAGFGIDEDEIEECERDIVEIAMRKLDNDRDGQITYEDFVRAVRMDALLLQAVGCCIPSTKSASAFQSLFTERYHMQSALYPKMPSKRADRGHKGKGHVHGHHSLKFGIKSDDEESSMNLRSSELNMQNSEMRGSDQKASIVEHPGSDSNTPVLPRASKVFTPTLKKLNRKSLSVVRHIKVPFLRTVKSRV